MDKASQEEVIEKYSGKLEKLSCNIPGSFEEEDIHQWRVEYKKLRAFLRLIVVQENEPVQIISEELKEYYKAAGTIRDMQLFIPTFQASLPDYLSTVPVFFGSIQKMLFSAKENFIKFSEEYSFDKERKNWYGLLPDYLSTERTKEFVQENVSAIRIIMLMPLEEDHLHSIRKHLKDILHNINTFSSIWGISFPVTAWRSEKMMMEAAEELGAFMDSCNRLFFLEPVYTDQLPTSEKRVLQVVEKRWKEEKDQQQALAKEKVKQLRFFRVAKEI